MGFVISALRMGEIQGAYDSPSTPSFGLAVTAANSVSNLSSARDYVNGVSDCVTYGYFAGGFSAGGHADTTTDMNDLTLTEVNGKKVDKEGLLKAFNEIQVPRPKYVLENMVVGSQDTSEAQYAHCVLEAQNAYDFFQMHLSGLL